MKFLILNTDYPAFLEWLYARHPGLEERSYAEQLRAYQESLFGVSDFYSSNLRKLGHEAWEIHANHAFLQRAWAREHGLEFDPRLEWRFRWRKGVLPWLGRLGPPAWFHRILEAQVESFKPDVLYNQALGEIRPNFLKTIKHFARLLVGQHAASPLPEEDDWKVYDLLVSSFPPTLEWFRARGMPTALNRLAFEPTVRERVPVGGPGCAVSFTGSFQPIHTSRVAWLERLCAEEEVHVWSPDAGALPSASPIRKHFHGPAWGGEMYRVLRDSKITLNHHGNVPPYANNLRLFEATGMGVLLLTDWKENLGELFEPGREVAAYRTAEECLDLLRHFLSHEPEREAIAKAGQRRTLAEHTYARRIKELADGVCRYL